MRNYILGSEINTTGAKTAASVDEAKYGRTGTFMTLSNGNQAGTLQESSDGGTTWTTVTSFSADSPLLEQVILYPLMRVNVVSGTTGKSAFLLQV